MKFDLVHWAACLCAALGVVSLAIGWWLPGFISLGYTTWWVYNGWRPWSPGFK